MIGMDQYELIRTVHRVYGKSIRQIARETGHHRETIRKALAGLEPKYRRKKQPRCPMMDPVAQIVERWLREDRDRPHKQRHTARRVYARLMEEYGFGGGESTVRRWVREWKAAHGEGAKRAVVPLDPEAAREAEVDWGSGWVIMAGQRQKVKLFCMRSRYSGKPFVRAYPAERQEMFFDGHMHAFAYYGGVFHQLVYDNLTTAVQQILRGKQRVEQERFVSLRSYYTFEARFCNPGQAQEKGGVENLIGFVQRNFLVPLPQVRDFEELNTWLLNRCEQHSYRKIQGRADKRTIEERHQQERAQLLALPQKPFENHKVLRVRINPYQTAQVDRNRYSVPRAYVGRWLWAHVGCDRVRFYTDQKQVAQHGRIFFHNHWQLDPLHYLELIEQRVGAFESARPIRQWREDWPPAYEGMLSGLRQRRGENRGTREFVHILQLHQSYARSQVEAAVTEALSLAVYSYEAVKHLIAVACESVPVPTALPAELLPGVTDRSVPASDVSRYDALLTGGQS